jgi:aromatic ring hydroxylase
MERCMEMNTKYDYLYEIAKQECEKLPTKFKQNRSEKYSKFDMVMRKFRELVIEKDGEQAWYDYTHPVSKPSVLTD